MNEAFDPYYRWLGIPPEEQPPHHYRLLGLRAFEDNQEVVSGAADRQMAFVQTFKTGPQSALSQKLLNELSTAKLTLLNPDKKAAYDAQLRPKLAPAPRPAPAVRTPPRTPGQSGLQHNPLHPAQPGYGLQGGAEVPPPLPPVRGSAPVANPFAQGMQPGFQPSFQPDFQGFEDSGRVKQSPYFWPAIAGGLLLGLVGIGSVAAVLMSSSNTPPAIAQGTGTPAPTATETGTAPLATATGTTLEAPANTAPIEPTRINTPPVPAATGVMIPRQPIPQPPVGPPRGQPNAGFNQAMSELGAKFNAAQARLVNRTIDAAGHADYGRGLLLIFGAWSRAMPHLVRGDDPELRELANTELSDEPLTPAQNLALGNRWWALGEQGKYPPDKFQAVAAWHYGMAIAGLPAAETTAAQERYKSVLQRTDLHKYLRFREPQLTNVAAPPSSTPLQRLRPNMLVLNDTWLPYAQLVRPLASSVAKVTYTLGIETAQLRGSIGLIKEDRSRMATPIAVQIKGDGRTLWSHANLNLGRKFDFTAELDHVSKLEIEIECSGPNDHADVYFDLVLSSGPNQLNPPTTPLGPIDVLAKLDLQAAAIAGTWSLGDDGLTVTGNHPHARLKLPVPTGEYYTINALVEPLSQHGLVFGLVLQDTPVALVIDGGPGPHSGLDTVGGHGYDANTTTRPGRSLRPNQLNKVTIEVQGKRVVATVNDQPVCVWNGAVDQLLLNSDWFVGDTPSLFVGSLGGQVRFQSIEVVTKRPTRIDGQLVLTPQPPADPPNGVGGNQNPPQDPPRGNVPPRRTFEGLLASRKEVPPADKRQEAKELIADLFKDELSSARKPDEKEALARKLMAQAFSTRDDDPAQFELFLKSADLAIDASAFPQAWQAYDAIEREYTAPEILTRREEMLKRASSASKTAPEQRTISECWIKLLNTAIERDEYDLAKKYAGEADKAATKAKDTMLAKLIDGGQKDLRELAKAYDACKAARETLKTSPEDAEASAAVGRFMCLYKNNWKAGLLLWAKGQTDPEAKLAQQDLQAGSDSAAQAAVGDGWWDLAQKTNETLPKKFLQQHAVSLYENALPSLVGLARAKVAKRIDDLQASDSHFPTNEWVDLIPLIDIDRHRRQGTWLKRDRALTITGMSTPAQLVLPVVLNGSYDLQVRFTRTKFEDAVGLCLPIAGRTRCGAFFGGAGNSMAGIERINGQRLERNPSGRPLVLTNNRSYLMTVSVDVAGDNVHLKGDLDGKEVFDWEGPISALSSPQQVDIGTLPTPLLYGYQSEFTFQQVKLRVRSGTAKPYLD